MSQPTNPQPHVEELPEVSLPVDEEWSEEAEAEWEAALDYLYAGDYFESHRDQDYWK